MSARRLRAAVALVVLAATLPGASAQAQTGGPGVLTQEERDYLAQRGPIRYVHNPTSPPLSFTKDGYILGIAPDLRNLMEVRLGLLFEIVVAANASDMIARIMNGSAEMAGGLAYSPERAQIVQFTQPFAILETYAWGPAASVTARDVGFAGATLAAVRGSAHLAAINVSFPDARVLPVGSAAQGLAAVRDGEAVAMVSALPLLAYESRLDPGFISFGPLGASIQTLQLGFSVNSDDPRLFAIIEKGLASISHDERRAIFVKWTGRDISPPIPAEPTLPLRTVGIATAALAGVGVVVLVPLWIATLRRRVSERTHKIRELNETLERRVDQRTRELEARNLEMEAFTYSVSHDLRAPLRAMDGFSQALLDDAGEKLSDAARDDVSRVRAASQRMGTLIDDLLGLSRLGRSVSAPTDVDLSALANDITRDLRQAAPERDVEVHIAPGLHALADPALVRVLLQNLVGNAWKFTSGKLHARIQVGQVPTPRGPAFYVRDDGAGFDPAFQDKLFAPFQRLHAASEFPGNGIGLATVRRIVGLYGGGTWAEGEIGKGATFYFTLPQKATP